MCRDTSSGRPVGGGRGEGGAQSARPPLRRIQGAAGAAADATMGRTPEWHGWQVGWFFSSTAGFCFPVFEQWRATAF